MRLTAGSGGCHSSRRLVRGGTAGLAGCLFAASLIAQDQTAQISGTVIDAATHQPVNHAMVQLNYQSPQNGRTSPPVSSDATGAFSFSALPEGRYLLSAMHSAYPNVPNHARVELKSGERATGVTLELVPGAVISGHVVDEDGDPLRGCFVQARPASPQSMQGGSGSNLNPDGEYRIHALWPGKYIVSVMCAMTVFVPRPFSAGPDPPPTLAYPTQLYPAAIDLAPGAEKPGVDFQMRPMPVTQVRGNILPAGEVPTEGMAMLLIPVDQTPQQQGRPLEGATFNKGTFEFHRVFPGSYYLQAWTNPFHLAALERVEVKDRPVELDVRLSNGLDLAGSITVEDNQSGNKTPITQLRVQLQPDLQIGAGVEAATVKEDGSFVLKSVPHSRWKVFVYGYPMFVKSVWLGNTDVTNTAFEVSPGSEALRIVVSSKLGTISGTAPAGETVFAALEGLPPFQGHRVDQVDPTGHFTMQQIAPGKYRVGVVEPGAPVPEDGGQEITVKEGETVTVDVKQN